MPPSGFVIPFFIVFGSRTMSLSRKFVLLGGFSVCFVHGVCSVETYSNCYPHEVYHCYVYENLPF